MNQNVIDLIKQRFSCRICDPRPLEREKKELLAAFVSENHTGPFGSQSRFEILAATEQDLKALKGLGTYGFVKGACGFIAGAMGQGRRNLEDFGYLMEHAILYATDLGLGTCWLGGSFTKSRFAKSIYLQSGESIPAVTSIGYVMDESKAEDWIRRRAGGAFRLPNDKLFFDEEFGKPLQAELFGGYAQVLDSVRWGPSASNRQPWRIIYKKGVWHLYLQRTKGYGKGSFLYSLLGIADLQRVDMGIAMCHFEFSARELGLDGSWVEDEPHINKPDEKTEYVVSWIPKI